MAVVPAEALLRRGSRCLIAFDGRRGPVLVPAAYWHDGDGLWAITAAAALEADAIGREGTCAVYVPGTPAVSATGRARLLSARDPVGLVLRAPAIAGVVAGLALHDPATLLSYARDALDVPQRWLPGNLVVLRLELSSAGLTAVGEPPPGVAPALPGGLPADIRRALVGVRRVVLARQVSGGTVPVEIAPAWWDGRFALTDAATGLPVEAAGRPVAVAVDVDPATSPPGVHGLVLHGSVDGGVLRAERATSWRGSQVETVDVDAAGSGVVLPD